MAIMAITTKSSTKVKPSAHRRRFVAAGCFIILIQLKFPYTGGSNFQTRTLPPWFQMISCN
jgi:hypothetical protein